MQHKFLTRNCLLEIITLTVFRHRRFRGWCEVATLIPRFTASMRRETKKNHINFPTMTQRAFYTMNKIKLKSFFFHFSFISLCAVCQIGVFFRKKKKGKKRYRENHSATKKKQFPMTNFYNIFTSHYTYVFSYVVNAQMICCRLCGEWLNLK